MRRERALVPVLIYLGMVVAVVSSLGAPLVPTLAVTEHVSLTTAQWSLTVTLLAGAIATPTMGRLADGPRRREVVLTVLGIVVAGSVLAALPVGFWWLVVGRALQGVGLGLTSLAIAVARDHVPPERARSAVALLSVTTVAGVGLGYPLTGLIATRFDVHAGFWFGAAVSLLALVLAAVFVPSSAGRPAHPLDVVGALLLAAGLAALLLGLSEAEQWGWTSLRLVAAAAAAMLLLASWVRHELRVEHPLVELGLLRRRAVLTADVTGLLGGVGMYLLLSLMTRFVQTPRSAGYGFGSSIVVAGLVLLPFSVGSVLGSRVAPAVARRFGIDRVLPFGCAIFLLAMTAFLLERSRLWEVLLVMGLAGLGVGCTFAAMPGLVMRAVPASETGSAISVNQVLRTVGYSMGSALSGTVLAAYTPSGARLPTGSGYGAAAVLGIGIWLVTGVVSALLPGRRVTGPDGAEQGTAGPRVTAGEDTAGAPVVAPADRHPARMRPLAEDAAPAAPAAASAMAPAAAPAVAPAGASAVAPAGASAMAPADRHPARMGVLARDAAPAAPVGAPADRHPARMGPLAGDAAPAAPAGVPAMAPAAAPADRHPARMGVLAGDAALAGGRRPAHSRDAT